MRASVLRVGLVVLLLLAALWAATNSGRLDAAIINDGLIKLGVWAPVAFVALFALGTVVFVPGAVLGLAGGALFGPVFGSVLNLIGATLGATLAFLIARYLASDLVERVAGGRLKRMISGVNAEGWRFVAFVRLVPVFPFNLSNYALGLTRVPVAHYVLASLLAMALGTFAFTWLGHAGREAMAGEAGAVRYGLLGLGALAAILILPRLMARFRQSTDWIEPAHLKQRLDTGEPLAIVDVRTPEEFTGELGHIASARNMPLPDLERRMNELAALEHVPLVLVCRTDKRSQSAAPILRAAGFQHVVVLRQGMVLWTRAGLPVEYKVANQVLQGGFALNTHVSITIQPRRIN